MSLLFLYDKLLNRKGMNLKILVTNDDGINAKGLKVLVQHLKEVGDVVVVAPDREQSAVGTSMTVRLPVKVNQVAPLSKGTTAYSVEGTPADSVILALELIIKDKVDLVVSGINGGLNIGYDVLLSGTVGAARNGSLRGIPSIALSVEGLEGSHLDASAKSGQILAGEFANNNLPDNLFLNVNLPNLPIGKIKGVQITRLGDHSYVEKVREDKEIGKSNYYWIIRPQSEWKLKDGTDIWAISNNMISITPLNTNLTTASNSSTIKELSSLLYKRLLDSAKL